MAPSQKNSRKKKLPAGAAPADNASHDRGPDVEPERETEGNGNDVAGESSSNARQHSSHNPTDPQPSGLLDTAPRQDLETDPDSMAVEQSLMLPADITDSNESVQAPGPSKVGHIINLSLEDEQRLKPNVVALVDEILNEFDTRFETVWAEIQAVDDNIDHVRKQQKGLKNVFLELNEDRKSLRHKVRDGLKLVVPSPEMVPLGSERASTPSEIAAPAISKDKGKARVQFQDMGPQSPVTVNRVLTGGLALGHGGADAPKKLPAGAAPADNASHDRGPDVEPERETEGNGNDVAGESSSNARQHSSHNPTDPQPSGLLDTAPRQDLETDPDSMAVEQSLMLPADITDSNESVQAPGPSKVGHIINLSLEDEQRLKPNVVALVDEILNEFDTRFETVWAEIQAVDDNIDHVRKQQKGLKNVFLELNEDRKSLRHKVRDGLKLVVPSPEMVPLGSERASTPSEIAAPAISKDKGKARVQFQDMGPQSPVTVNRVLTGGLALGHGGADAPVREREVLPWGQRDGSACANRSEIDEAMKLRDPRPLNTSEGVGRDGIYIPPQVRARAAVESDTRLETNAQPQARAFTAAAPDDGGPPSDDSSDEGGADPNPNPPEGANRGPVPRYVPDPERDPDETSDVYNVRRARHRVVHGPPPPVSEQEVFDESAYENSRMTPPHMQYEFETPSAGMPAYTNVRFRDGEPIGYDRAPPSVGPSISARVPNVPQAARSDFVPSSASAIHRMQSPLLPSGQFADGTSMVPNTPQVGMIGQSNHDRERLIERFKRKLGRELKTTVNSSVAKNYKFDITQYSGEDDFDVLEQFCIQLFRMMRILHLCGMNSEIDEDRIEIIGNNLKGRALDWFNREVDGAAQMGVTMRTVDVIRGLYDRFVHRSSATTAVEKYQACAYNPEEGIAAYYDEMIFLAGKMIQMPDAYSLRKKFWNGIPGRVTSQMMVPYGLSPEENDMKTLVASALHVERSLKENKRKEEAKLAQAANKRTTTGASTPRPANSTPRVAERERSPRLRDREQRDHSRSPSRDRDRSRDRTGRRDRSFNRDARRTPSQPFRSGGSTSTAKPSAIPAAKLGANQCRLCGKEGHWSNECPTRTKYTNTARINAARIETEYIAAMHDARSEAGDSRVGNDGPQYDSDAGLTPAYEADYDSDQRGAIQYDSSPEDVPSSRPEDSVDQGGSINPKLRSMYIEDLEEGDEGSSDNPQLRAMSVQPLTEDEEIAEHVTIDAVPSLSECEDLATAFENPIVGSHHPNTWEEIYRLGWDEAVSASIHDLNIMRDALDPSKGMDVILAEGVQRAIVVIAGLYDTVPAPVGSTEREVAEPSSQADGVVKQRLKNRCNREKKSRYRNRLRERLREAEALLYESESEVGRANSGAEQGDDHPAQVSCDYVVDSSLDHLDSGSSDEEDTTDYVPRSQQLRVVSVDDEGSLVRLAAMAPERELSNKEEAIASWVYDANINRNPKDSEQPQRSAEECRVMAVMMTNIAPKHKNPTSLRAQKTVRFETSG
ncbi:uncharacterized protein STEHIDRAFT_116554 [Stereum hirsutum FP-91666 SS1]|uniref:CCHC-type domain-containing protein n=1 Tax=Stereum hirsutum (strain FP-91666) TaxID=721885 RepID=R7RX09_STEHR|nr:uncharacterized protein STEHIDRAFT_116554 [Stereum hirsutum FP-91666 SS1]EIM79348.1 hypothetical protein STEHIDRAFT_116554 [Stereum hirsutum FP-91666 SS1]